MQPNVQLHIGNGQTGMSKVLICSVQELPVIARNQHPRLAEATASPNNPWHYFQWKHSLIRGKLWEVHVHLTILVGNGSFTSLLSLFDERSLELHHSSELLRFFKIAFIWHGSYGVSPINLTNMTTSVVCVCTSKLVLAELWRSVIIVESSASTSKGDKLICNDEEIL